MEIPRLSDFTTEQLQVLLTAVAMRRTDSVGDPITHKEKETLLLLQTQILNAIGKVAVQEEINSN